MIPLAIRRHSLQDLTLGQSTLLKVPACEERQIRRGVGVVNAERSDGLRLKTLRTPDGLRVGLVESVAVADSPEWRTGKSRRFPGRDPDAVQKAVVKLNEWARVLRRPYRFRVVVRDSVPVVLKLPKNKTIRIRREAELSRVMRAVERQRAGQGKVVSGVELCDIIRSKWRFKKLGIRF
ncbi:MAG: hypothetical protein ACK528_02600, partial [Alphaproteobacteria bacterium]